MTGSKSDFYFIFEKALSTWSIFMYWLHFYSSSSLYDFLAKKSEKD